MRFNCESSLSAALETALEPTYDHAPGAVGDGGAYSARLAFHNNLGSGCGIKVDLDGMPNGIVIPPLNVTGEKFISQPRKRKITKMELLSILFAGTESEAVQDEEGHDLLPFLISKDTELTLSATVYTRNIGGKPCENVGETISDFQLVIVPGKVNLMLKQILSCCLMTYAGKTKSSPPPTQNRTNKRHFKS